MGRKLRIAVLLNEFVLPAWKYSIISRLAGSDFADIVLVLKSKSACSSPGSIRRSLPDMLIRFLEKADRLIFRNKTDYLAPRNASAILKDIRLLDLTDMTSEETSILNAERLGEIRNTNPDLILKFDGTGPSGDIREIPKYGIWEYSIDDRGIACTPATGFREVINKVPVTGSKLLSLTGDSEKPRVIFSSFEATCRYSININRNNLAWRSALFAPRIIEGIYRNGEKYLEDLILKYSGEDEEAGLAVMSVKLAEAIRSISSYLLIVSGSILKKVWFTDAFSWHLLFRIDKSYSIDKKDFKGFRKLRSPGHIFWADPFILSHDEHYYLYVEEFVYSRNRAHITVLNLDKEGNLLTSEKIIEKPYHMSYPFIFRAGGVFYMIPETCQNRTIDLYKCTVFPNKWEFARSLMKDISAVDTTLFHYNGKWWLFTSVDQTGNIAGCSTELFLFFTDDFEAGNWIAHPQNPVVSDVRKARPAGKILIIDGKIYRPSQNCAGRYGIGFNLNRITQLTESEYEESVADEIKPEWDRDLKGTHTLNSDEDFTVIDVYSFRRRFSISPGTGTK